MFHCAHFYAGRPPPGVMSRCALFSTVKPVPAGFSSTPGQQVGPEYTAKPWTPWLWYNSPKCVIVHVRHAHPYVYVCADPSVTLRLLSRPPCNHAQSKQLPFFQWVIIKSDRKLSLEKMGIHLWSPLALLGDSCVSAGRLLCPDMVRV